MRSGKKRPSRPPRSARSRPSPKARWSFRVAAYVRRKIDEHAQLTQDSLRIALSLIFLFLAFMLLTALYKTWQENQQAPDPIGHSLRR